KKIYFKELQLGLGMGVRNITAGFGKGNNNPNKGGTGAGCPSFPFAAAEVLVEIPEFQPSPAFAKSTAGTGGRHYRIKLDLENQYEYEYSLTIFLNDGLHPNYFLQRIQDGVILREDLHRSLAFNLDHVAARAPKLILKYVNNGRRREGPMDEDEDDVVVPEPMEGLWTKGKKGRGKDKDASSCKTSKGASGG
ncbi:unnamed protein product, partial [Amoebophrya sp. A25]